MKKTKLMSAQEAAGLIRDGDCVAISAAGLIGYPDLIAAAIEDRYEKTGHPAALTLYSGCGHGVPFLHEGDARFAAPGLLKKVICSHPEPVPGVRKLIESDAVEAYILPQGVLQQLYRCAASRQPGLLSRIGLGTYIDPRLEGGKANSVTTKDIVSLTELDGDPWLFYRAFPVTAAIIRGTTADADGNLTIEHEALKLELLEIALAARASGGRVIAQVERTAACGTLSPKDIVVPGELVDAVVVCDDIAKHHRQTAATVYSPYLSGELRAAPHPAESASSAGLSAADVICRRAAFELFPGAIVNVGVGVGAGIGAVARAEGLERELTFTLELGAFGGTPQSMADFGSTENPTAFISHPSMFDFYHGGGLDITFLGAAQIDRTGNVNSSKFGGHAAGQGGFIDISQSSRKVVFCTLFRAKGLKAHAESGGLVIDEEGSIPKLVPEVEQITFSAKLASEMGKPVVYITERCVFELTPEGLMLTEIAPGIDIQRDILDEMDFVPLISERYTTMDARIFTPGAMGLKFDC